MPSNNQNVVDLLIQSTVVVTIRKIVQGEKATIDQVLVDGKFYRYYAARFCSKAGSLKLLACLTVQVFYDDLDAMIRITSYILALELRRRHRQCFRNVHMLKNRPMFFNLHLLFIIDRIPTDHTFLHIAYRGFS